MSGSKIDVVSAIIEKNGRFLMGKRSPHKQSAPGYWCPISGRIEPGESQAAAVEREVAEETGLVVRASAKVAECDTHDGSALIHWWRALPEGDATARLANDEHTELAWLSIEELKRLEPVFLEDVAIIERFGSPAASGGVAAAYDRWASRYDDDHNRTRSLAAQVLRQTPLELPGRRVVEAGCGTGQNTAWLAERAESVLGLDLSEGMLARARVFAGAPHVRFAQHDITTPWPLGDAAADVAVAMLVLEHVESLAPFFEQAARVLAPGGQLWCCELHPARQMLGKQARFATTEQVGADGSLTARYVECVSAFPHDVSDYVNTAHEAGFTLEHLGEWRDEGAAFSVPPRLLTASFRAR